MNTKRIFAACILTALLALAASAQSNDQRALWKKYIGRNATTVHRQSLSVDAEDAQKQREDSQTGFAINAVAPKGILEGTWLATVTFEDNSSIKVLFTFMQGRDDTEGTLMDTNEFLLTPDPIGTPDQGVWQRTGDRSFIATHLAFLFSQADGGAPAGTAKVRDSITVSDLGDKFTGRQFVEGFDPNGAPIFSVHATMTAVRLKAEAPPAN